MNSTLKAGPVAMLVTIQIEIKLEDLCHYATVVAVQDFPAMPTIESTIFYSNPKKTFNLKKTPEWVELRIIDILQMNGMPLLKCELNTNELNKKIQTVERAAAIKSYLIEGFDYTLID